MHLTLLCISKNINVTFLSLYQTSSTSQAINNTVNTIPSVIIYDSFLLSLAKLSQCSTFHTHTVYMFLIMNETLNKKNSSNSHLAILKMGIELFTSKQNSRMTLLHFNKSSKKYRKTLRIVSQKKSFFLFLSVKP